MPPEVGGPPRRTSNRTPLFYLVGVISPLGVAFFLFVIGAIGQPENRGRNEGGLGLLFFLIVVGFLLLRAVVGVVSWQFRTYEVGPAQLVIDEGVFTRRRRVVPYDRVQQVDTHQNAVAQLFTISELRVATAITSGTENVKLLYLDAPTAAGLRTYILQRRAVLQAGTSGHGDVGTPDGTSVEVDRGRIGPAMPADSSDSEPDDVLLSLSPLRLVLASLTHSSLLIGAATGLVIGLWTAASVALDARFQLAVLLGGGIVAAVAVTTLSALMVISRNLLERYGFTMSVRGDDLELRMGLLDTRNITVPRRRVQQISIIDNPLRRVLGLVSVELHTASAGGERSRFDIPLVDRDDVDDLLVRLMGSSDWRPPSMTPRPDRARVRAVRRRVLVTAAVLVPPAYVLRPLGYLLLLIAVVGLPWGRVAHRRAGSGISGTLVGLTHGVLLHRTELVPLTRVQSCRTATSPFQRRADLATLSVDVAGHDHFAFLVGAGPHLLDMERTEADRLEHDLPRATGPGVAVPRAGNRSCPPPGVDGG